MTSRQDRTKKLEKKLVSLSSSGTVRRAWKMLTPETLLCCYQNSNQRLNAVFNGNQNVIEKVSVSLTDHSDYHCSCSAYDSKLCPHAVASLLHHTRFHNLSGNTHNEDKPAEYQALKLDSLSKVADMILPVPEAELIIKTYYKFPHAPSKWERFIFKVTLLCNKKEYVGNLGNLRQLHFGKSLAASIGISQFSLQDRQIIRFLAINAEPESRNLSLDSEQTSELYHCLIGRRNFTLNEQQINIRQETAEPVLLCEKRESDCLLRSAIAVSGKLVPLKAVKIITGKGGCWVGISGEYWWLPATIDVNWLRSFLRTSEQNCDFNKARLLLSECSRLPIKIIESGAISPFRSRKCQLIYSAALIPPHSLELKISFNYSGKTFSPDGLRLAHDKEKFWKRNSAKEQEAIKELLSFGFQKDMGNVSRFKLCEEEATGVFLDVITPKWIKEGKEFYMSANFAALANGGTGLCQFKLACGIVAEETDHFILKYRIYTPEGDISWKKLIQMVRDNRNYTCLKSGKFAKIGDEAINVLEEGDEQISLVIADLLMPVCTGWELIEYMKNHDALKDIPIIAITGLATSINEFERVKSNCNAVLHKGDFDLAEFTAVIKQFI